MRLALQGFEQVRRIHVDSEPFSVENGLTTPTFKHKRPQLQQHYKADIDRCAHPALPLQVSLLRCCSSATPSTRGTMLYLELMEGMGEECFQGGSAVLWQISCKVLCALRRMYGK